MLGLNKTITVKKTTQAVTASGSSAEAEEIVATGVPAAIQPFVLNNMPPPPDRRYPSGDMYTEEFRCWVSRAALTDIESGYIVIDEGTDEEYRVVAVVDDAGRSHHWVLRLVKYS